EGKLTLGDLLPLEGVTEDELLRLAAAVETPSEHPIARLIVAEASRRLGGAGQAPRPHETVEDFRARPGGGGRGRLGGDLVLAGNRRLLEEEGVALTPEALALLDQLDATGQSALLVARAGRVLGAVGFHDRLRPEAPLVLTELRNLGVGKIALL